MIQRVQTLYLLVACALCVVTLCNPLAYFSSAEGSAYGVLYNLWLTLAEGDRAYTYWALFALMLLCASICLSNVFLYKFRALQMRVTSFTMVLLTGWYMMYALFIYSITEQTNVEFRPNWTAALPFASIVLLYLAFRGIYRDEQLVRSLDRLR